MKLVEILASLSIVLILTNCAIYQVQDTPKPTVLAGTGTTSLIQFITCSNNTGQVYV